MTSDLNKGISLIEYNYLNLPEHIVYSSDYEISYLYTASGQKLKKIVNTGSGTVTTDYAGNFVYNTTGDLEYFTMGEGRMTPISGQPGQYQPEYFMTDHLGNVRLVYADYQNDGVMEILQETHYYPFGQSLGGLNYTNNVLNKLKYNGKELETENNLQWYDYGFRRYDPQLGRWHVMDAMAEKYKGVSGYVYVQNNPICYVDLLGFDALNITRGSGLGGSFNYFLSEFGFNYIERTVVDDEGEIISHDESADKGIYEVDEEGNETRVGTELPYVDYLVGSYLLKYTDGTWSPYTLTLNERPPKGWEVHKINIDNNFFIFALALHWEIGNGEPVEVNTKDIGLNEYNWEELDDYTKVYDDGTMRVDLFDLFGALGFFSQRALSFGRIILKPLDGNSNQYYIVPNELDFRFDPDATFLRNEGARFGGFLMGRCYNEIPLFNLIFTSEAKLFFWR